MALQQRTKLLLKQRFAPVQRLCSELLEVPLADLDNRIEAEQEQNPYLEQEIELVETPIQFETTEKIGRRTDKGEFFDYWFQDDGDQIYRVSKQDDTTEKEYGSSFSVSLSEELLEQLRLTNVDQYEYSLGEMVIGNIDEKGYLQRSVDALADDYFFDKGEEVNIEKLHKVIRIIRTFEPAGVGARNLQDCLMLQLERIDGDSEELTLAKEVIDKYWDLFFKKNTIQIEKKMNLNQETFERILNLIHTLNPYPGHSEEGMADNSSILPDFKVWLSDGVVKFNLNRQYKRSLKVSKEGVRMLEKFQKDPDKHEETIKFLKNKIEAANIFIEAFNQRESTLERIMKAIIDLQYDYFISGDLAKLKPMKYEDIKNVTGYTESTISRMANDKYAQTHFGTFKLKDFFSNTLTNSDGEEISSEAVRNCMLSILDSEDKAKPYTDEQLAELLQEKGFPISRRTVAKYRDKLGIETASKRKNI